MNVSYDSFVKAFLGKITEFEYIKIPEEGRTSIVDGYLKRAISSFRSICKNNFTYTSDDENRTFDIDITENVLDDVINIVSDGMVVHWLKPYVYQQELLQNVLNTKDYTSYSPAELLLRVGNAYKQAQNEFKQAVIDYTYTNGELGDLHL